MSHMIRRHKAKNHHHHNTHIHLLASASIISISIFDLIPVRARLAARAAIYSYFSLHRSNVPQDPQTQGKKRMHHHTVHIYHLLASASIISISSYFIFVYFLYIFALERKNI